MKHSDRLLLLYKEYYFFEQERKAKIESRVGVVMAALTLLVGVVVYYLNNLVLSGSEFWLVAFIVLLAALVLTLIPAFWQISKFFLAHEYGYASNTDAVAGYVSMLESYNKQVDCGDQVNIDENLDTFLTDQYREAAAHNYTVNKNKSAQLFKASRSLVVATVVAALSAIPYFALKTSQPEKTYEVRIIEQPHSDVRTGERTAGIATGDESSSERAAGPTRETESARTSESAVPEGGSGNRERASDGR